MRRTDKELDKALDCRIQKFLDYDLPPATTGPTVE
jgi:hypothetical protein